MKLQSVSQYSSSGCSLYSSFRSKLPLWMQALVVGGTIKVLSEVYDTYTELEYTSEVIVLTGAASGIGRLLAIKLAKAGARLALWDLNEMALMSLKSELLLSFKKNGDDDMSENEHNNDIKTYVIDITNRDLVYQTADAVLKDFGQVDVLINNAGIVSGKKIHQAEDEMMERTMHVNTISHFWTLKAFLPQMLERNHGQIVTVASMAGIVGTAGLVDYCASKFAAVGIAESLRMELRKQRKDGISSVCICPFYIKTGMFEGATSKYEALFPLLEPQYAADQIFQAMKRKTAVLMMPRMCYTIPALKCLLPTFATDAIADFFDVNSSMDNFVQTRK